MKCLSTSLASFIMLRYALAKDKAIHTRGQLGEGRGSNPIPCFSFLTMKGIAVRINGLQK